MAQESWKESDETECQKPEGPVLCANNCGFFGSAATNDLCSKCYRDMFMNQQLVVTSVSLMAEKKATTALTSMQAELAVELDKVEKVQVFHVDASQSEEISNKQPANRCLMCRKRVGLVGFKCRCGGTFCSTHRYSEMHTCSFDYRSAGREAIAKANPVVRAEKIEKI